MISSSALGAGGELTTTTDNTQMGDSYTNYRISAYDKFTNSFGTPGANDTDTVYATAVGDNQAGIDAANQVLGRWQNTFGSIENNLKDYYSNLDPVKFATQSKNQLQSNMQKSMVQFNEYLAQTGMQSAGMEAQNKKETSFELAKGNAQIDINAPEVVAQMKAGFLDYGKDFRLQGEQMLGNASNIDSDIRSKTSMYNASAYNNMVQFDTNAQIAREEIDAQESASNASGWGSAIGAGIGLIAMSDVRLKNNITRIGTHKGHGLYKWDWTELGKELAGDTPTTGVLAQEVMVSTPNAVHRGSHGYLMVDYGAL